MPNTNATQSMEFMNRLTFETRTGGEANGEFVMFYDIGGVLRRGVVQAVTHNGIHIRRRDIDIDGVITVPRNLEGCYAFSSWQSALFIDNEAARGIPERLETARAEKKIKKSALTFKSPFVSVSFGFEEVKNIKFLWNQIEVMRLNYQNSLKAYKAKGIGGDNKKRTAKGFYEINVDNTNWCMEFRKLRKHLLTPGKKVFTVKYERKHIKIEEEYLSYKGVCSFMRSELRKRIQYGREMSRRLETMEMRIDLGDSHHRCTVVGGIHLNAGVFLDAHRIKQARIVYARKMPRNKKAEHVGIELEFFCDVNKEELASVLVEAGMGKYVYITSDGSISGVPENMYSHEVCVLSTVVELPTVVNKVTAALLSVNGRVNESCGLHVHLDMRKEINEIDKDTTGMRIQEEMFLGWGAIGLVFNNLIRAHGVLVDCLPGSRRDNQYCRRNTEMDVQRAARGERYRMVNATALNKHKTLEVRSHSGTLDPVKVLNWVGMLLLVKNYGTKIEKTPRSVFHLCERIGASPEMKRYFTERSRRFTGKEVMEHEVTSRELAGV